MVKRPKIARKPTTPPAAEDWVKSGGLDPEVRSIPAPEPKPTEVENKKPYPHRISFDTDTPQYKRLKKASFEAERSLNDILREAVENWLKARGY